MLRGLRGCSREAAGFVAASRAFSSSSVLHEKIDIKPFTTASGRSISTSKWSLPLLKQFCCWDFKSGLGFTKVQLENVPLLPAPDVFARCPSEKDEITQREWKLDLADVPEKEQSLVRRDVGAAFAALEEVLRQHERPAAPKTPRPKKPRIDVLAFKLLQLCGFDDWKDFGVNGESIEFMLAGATVNRKAGAYMASRIGDSSQVVFIWEDKQGADALQSVLDNSAARIIGQLLSVHYRNHVGTTCEPTEVYAVRIIDDMVAFFRLEMSAEQVRAVCEDGVIPNPILQVCVASCVACRVVCAPCLHHRSTMRRWMHWMLATSTG